MKRFAPSFSKVTACLWKLTAGKDDAELQDQWKQEHQLAYDEVIKMASEKLANTHFDPSKHVTVVLDASPWAISATLLQDGDMVLCVSRLLTKTERNYSQIEREFLAMKYGLLKLRVFLLAPGRKFDVWTDHKPLLGIVRKAECDNKRLMRFKVDIDEFVQKMNLMHIEGKNNFVADYWTRVWPPATDDRQADRDIGVNAIATLTRRRHGCMTTATRIPRSSRTVKLERLCLLSRSKTLMYGRFMFLRNTDVP